MPFVYSQLSAQNDLTKRRHGRICWQPQNQNKIPFNNWNSAIVFYYLTWLFFRKIKIKKMFVNFFRTVGYLVNANIKKKWKSLLLMCVMQLFLFYFKFYLWYDGLWSKTVATWWERKKRKKDPFIEMEQGQGLMWYIQNFINWLWIETIRWITCYLTVWTFHEQTMLVSLQGTQEHLYASDCC